MFRHWRESVSFYHLEKSNGMNWGRFSQCCGDAHIKGAFESVKRHLCTIRIILQSLTSPVHVKGFLQFRGQRKFASFTERAREVIHVKGPDHGTSKVLLLKPLGLVKKRGQDHLDSCHSSMGPQYVQGTVLTLIVKLRTSSYPTH